MLRLAYLQPAILFAPTIVRLHSDPEGSADRWLETASKPAVSRVTYERYVEMVTLYIVPHIGSVKLAALSARHIQGLYATLAASGRKDGRGGLASRTIGHVHRLLHKALRTALEWQILPRNPAAFAHPPKVAHQEAPTLSSEQIHELLSAAVGTVVYIPILIACTTGMRRGEIVALQWQDIDLAGGTLAVRRTANVVDGGTVYKDPKTASSRRVVAIPPVLVRELVMHKGLQAEHKLSAGDCYQDNGWVCAWEDGRPVTPTYLSQQFQRILQSASLPHVRFHDLRHSHATMLLEAGIHAKVVQERLGHSSVRVTLDIYSHVVDHLQRGAADAIEAVLKDVGSK